jgi:hypothetical protein
MRCCSVLAQKEEQKENEAHQKGIIQTTQHFFFGFRSFRLNDFKTLDSFFSLSTMIVLCLCGLHLFF